MSGGEEQPPLTRPAAGAASERVHNFGLKFHDFFLKNSNIVGCSAVVVFADGAMRGCVSRPHEQGQQEQELLRRQQKKQEQQR